jgi:outer membrane protein OmpA-like peptidoglycan-associated protein
MNRFALALTGFLFFQIHQINAQTSPPSLAGGYYIVVSAYRPAQADLAQKQADKLSAQGVQADLGLDPKRNYCYVIIGKYNDYKESISEMQKTRQAGSFSDAWVRVLRDGDVIASAKEVSTAPAQATQTSKSKPDATVYIAIPKPEVTDQPKVEEVKEMPSPAPQTLVASVVNNLVTEVVENPVADPVIMPQTLANTPIFLSLFNARNSRVVDGEIEVIDTERSRTITKVKGNSYLNLPDPKSSTGELTLICNAFGFRKVQHQIHYKNTESDTLQPHVDLVGNFYLVKFDLVRLHKGDISVLYNVYFYNDAAIMLPESKPELNSLLAMMQDNPRYKIKLHGHTNGNASGPIIKMGPSQDFFSLTTDVNKGYGSAKELSGERAETIREWLIANGVTADRIEVKAWGGGRMLHDKHSVHARRNVRVEVEVLED